MSNQFIHRPTKHLSRRDIGWIFSFMGTAIGAGILFLPLQAAQGGFWVFLVSSLLALPISYLSLRIFALFQLSTPSGLDYTEAVKYYTNPYFGFLTSSLYFLTFIFILVAYTTALNNDMAEFIIHYSPIAVPLDLARQPLHSFSLIFLMCAIIIYGENVLLRTMELMTIPLLIAIGGISLSLIPFWNGGLLSIMPSPYDFVKNLLMVIPLISFTVLYYTAISAMISAYRSSWPEFSHQDDVEKKSLQILNISQIILSLFIFFFILSCLFTLDMSDIQTALQKNVSVVSVLAPHLQNTPGILSKFLEFLVPIVGILAIITSFLGTILGTKEGAKSVIVQVLKKPAHEIKFFGLSLDSSIIILIGFILWLFTLLNWSVSSLLGMILTPILALMFFFMTSILYLKVIKKNDKMSGCKKYWSQIFCWILILFGFFLIISYAIGSRL